MAAKKKEEAKEVKAPKGDAFLTFIGKTLTDLRKTVAGLLGDTSRHDDELRTLTQRQKETSGRVAKLVADPIYSVPDTLKKRLDVLEQKHKTETLKLISRISELEEKLKTKTPAATSRWLNELQGGIQVLEAKVEQLTIRADDNDTEVAALEESLGVTVPFIAKMKADDGEAAMTPPPSSQLTLDEAIAQTNSVEVKP